MSAVTGQTGKGLQEIEKYARQTAKTFGGEASQAAESYKLILSQLSPEIAKCPEALKAMGDSAAITAKLMGGDVAAATSVLTTAMNQFQVSTVNSLEASKEMGRMMNIMAAAAQAGSAELPAIQQALEQSGMAAKAAGVSFSEANSAIQVLDKAGKKGSEGGIALRNVMATLSQGRFLPQDVQEELQAAGVRISDLTNTSKTLSERLNPLKAVMGDAALITKLFGKENANAAVALLAGTEQMDVWTNSILGTNSATEQAQIVMSSYAEKMSRLKAKMDDLKISFFSVAKGALPFLQAAMTATQGVANVFNIACGAQTLSETALGKAIVFRAKATKTATLAMWNNIKAMFTSQNLFKIYFNSVLFCSFALQIFKNRVQNATRSLWANIRSVVASLSSMGVFSVILGVASAST
ncbi:MAG: phage tail tape measure protein, partial [Bacteroidales bacterium]